MSELFNALQKLEEKNASDSPPVPPPVSGNNHGKRSRVPYLRVLLLLLFVLLVTGLSLAFLWFQPELPFIAKDIQHATSVSEETLPESPEDLPEEVPQPGVVIEKIQVEDTTGILEKRIPGAEGRLKGSALQSVEKTVTATTAAIVVEEEKAMEGRLQNIDTLNQEFVGENHQLQSVDKLHDTERERNMVQRKRLVYRAEKLRAQGDVAAALKLYKQAWDISPNPALANNMAAILISTAQYAKAEKYLQQGLNIAPEDADLLYNLQITRQGRKQK